MSKSVLTIITLICTLAPLFSYAHPGKTDYRGGHKCLKNCEEWKLEYGEYHLHDKDWNPVRVNITRNPVQNTQSEITSENKSVLADSFNNTQIEKSPEQSAIEHRGTDTGKHNNDPDIHEEGFFSVNIISLLIFLVLLLISLILLRRKSKKS